MIEIKPLGADRWNDLRRLRLAALEQEPIAFGSSVEEDSQLSEPEWRRRIASGLFAVDEGEPIGMIMFAREGKRKIQHIVGIYGVYVEPDYRGRGVGQQLLAAAIAAIRLMPDVVKIKLTVNPEQMAAVKLYERCGFEAVGRLQKELRVGGAFYDEVIMERVLE